MLRKLFLNDKFILGVILLNSVIIYLQVTGLSAPIISILDFACTLIFFVEMIIKNKEFGVKAYWKSGWNPESVQLRDGMTSPTRLLRPVRLSLVVWYDLFRGSSYLGRYRGNEFHQFGFR